MLPTANVATETSFEDQCRPRRVQMAFLRITEWDLNSENKYIKLKEKQSSISSLHRTRELGYTAICWRFCVQQKGFDSGGLRLNKSIMITFKMFNGSINLVEY